MDRRFCAEPFTRVKTGLSKMASVSRLNGVTHHNAHGSCRLSAPCMPEHPSDSAHCIVERSVNSVVQQGNNMQLLPCCGGEAVGYSLYHRQSASGEDAPQSPLSVST